VIADSSSALRFAILEAETNVSDLMTCCSPSAKPAPQKAPDAVNYRYAD
jgi:hypothetical protein